MLRLGLQFGLWLGFRVETRHCVAEVHLFGLGLGLGLESGLGLGLGFESGLGLGLGLG